MSPYSRLQCSYTIERFKKKKGISDENLVLRIICFICSVVLPRFSMHEAIEMQKKTCTYSCAWCIFMTFQGHSLTFEYFLNTTLLSRTIWWYFILVHNDFGYFGNISMTIWGRTVVATSIIWCDALEFQVISIDLNRTKFWRNKIISFGGEFLARQLSSCQIKISNK